MDSSKEGLTTFEGAMSFPDDIDKPFSFRSKDEVLRDEAEDSDIATLGDIFNRVDKGLIKRNGLSLSFIRNIIKKWIEDAVEPVVIALQEKGEDLRRCRQHAIELEEKKLLRKRQMILMKRRRAGRWSPTRRSKNGRVQKGAERAGRVSAGGASAVSANVAAMPMSVRREPTGTMGSLGYSPAAAAAAVAVSTNSLRRSIRRHRRNTSLLKYL